MSAIADWVGSRGRGGLSSSSGRHLRLAWLSVSASGDLRGGWVTRAGGSRGLRRSSCSDSDGLLGSDSDGNGSSAVLAVSGGLASAADRTFRLTGLADWVRARWGWGGLDGDVLKQLAFSSCC